MNYTIEKLNRDNALEYAKVNALAWKESYPGIINDDFLEFINREEEINKLAERLKNSLNDSYKDAYLLKVNNKCVGILNLRESKYDEYTDCGELGAIYLLNEAKGQGYGKILVQKAISELKKKGFKKMINGCFEGNPSNEFYKHMGGKLVGSTLIKIPNGQELIENFYLYENI